ncbi:MAG: FIST C-terminal domain-containing protein [Spirochaetaceae bacterium]|jgi:hypothetical protein|nr:FIST C-terminal domain-containing protein [Spirochaetaceae bacterium]
MIHAITLCTESIDDKEGAVRELKAQLDASLPLLRNSVGIIACHYEFVLSGMVKTVQEALPFDIVGTISSAQTVNNGAGALLLTLMVLTSDDVQFKTVLTPSLKTESGRKIEESYKNALATNGGEKPSLIFAFAPFMVENSGDEYVNVLTKASGGVPCFGTLAVDDTSDFRECYMMYRGEHYRDCLAMILVYGKVEPRFYLASISHNKILDKSALITSSEGHLLKELNGRPVSEYFASMGLTKASETSYAMTSLPFMLDYNDGSPMVSKVFIGLDEHKNAICAGAMPEGSTLYIGVFDKEDVLLTTGQAVKDAFAEREKPSLLLAYSCISRSMSLGSDIFAEADLIKKENAGNIPFLIAYSGGEICPTQIRSESAVNRFHNNTFILCAL